MKVRTGFVSNSSSSSFIIGVGIATDKDAIAELEKIKGWELELLPLSEVVAQEHNNSWSGDGYNAELDRFKISSFQYSDESVSGVEKSYLKHPEGVIVKISLCEGDDSDFWNEEWSEYDYDIDLDFFEESTQELVGKCEDLSDVGTFSWHYGAGRNG